MRTDVRSAYVSPVRGKLVAGKKLREATLLQRTCRWRRAGGTERLMQV